MALERSDLKPEAVKMDGSYLEDIISGFHTFYTVGREYIGKDFDSLSVGSAHGETLKSSKYQARTIEVGFAIVGTDEQDVIDKINHLNNLMNIDEADFVFNDESDKYFTGYPYIDSQIKRSGNLAKGAFKIYCADPFKYSLAPIVKSTDDASGVVIEGNTATFTFDYNGTFECHPTLQASFASAKSGGDYNDDGDCGYVAFMDEAENIIQLGNPDALDIDAYTSAVALANRDFESISGWTESGWNKTWGDKTIAGSVASAVKSDSHWNRDAGWSKNCANPTYGSGTDWHGPLLWKQTTGGINFDVNLVHRFCCNSSSEVGTFECGVYNTSGTTPYMVAGFVIDKSGAGTTATIRYIVNGKEVGTDSIDVSYYNTHFGYCRKDPVYTTYSSVVYYTNKKKKKVSKKKTKYYNVYYTTVCTGYNYTQSNLNSSIKKSEGTITFKVGNCSQRTFTDSALEQIAGHNLSMHFGANAELSTLNTNCVQSVVFKNNGNNNKTFASIPNVFMAGDIVEANCNDASVYIMRNNTIDGQYSPQYGALGNNWEGFALHKGQNIISCSWSDWVNEEYLPTIKIIYNEVFV